IMLKTHAGSRALVIGLVDVGFAAAFAFGRHWTFLSEGGATASGPQRVHGPETGDPRLGDRPTRYKIPVTDTQPQRGPQDALVTVVEWCDLRGEACRAADKAMRQLMDEHPGKLRWVHRHLPAGVDFEQSERMHEFARGAFQLDKRVDKFWEVRERLLAVPGEAPPEEGALRQIAEDLALDYEGIEQGMKLRHY